jgi:acyl-CoA thioester hydrolase
MPVWSAPVRYAECDQQGVVFNGHYLTWCDEAATAWMAAVGTPYDALHTRNLDTRVVATALEWSSSAR